MALINFFFLHSPSPQIGRVPQSVPDDVKKGVRVRRLQKQLDDAVHLLNERERGARVIYSSP